MWERLILQYENNGNKCVGEPYEQKFVIWQIKKNILRVIMQIMPVQSYKSDLFGQDEKSLKNKS